MRSAVIAVVVGNLVVTGLLLAMVVVRKLRRDRREAQHRVQRDVLRAALLHGQRRLDRQLRLAARRPALHADLAIALAGLSDVDVLDQIRSSAVRTGLAASLGSQLTSDDVPTRGGAAMLLGLLRAPGAAAWLRPLLDDPDGDVQLAAAGALGHLADDDAAAALVDALAASSLTRERLIERLDGPWAVPAILDRLARTTPADAALRCALARALGLTDDVRAEPALVALLRHGAVEERVSAARGLASTGLRAASDALLVAMDDPAWEVRAQAATSLAALGVVAAVPALEANLGHDAWWVRANTADALARLGRAGVAALERAAAGHDRYAAERAAETLAGLGRRRTTRAA